MAVRMLGELSLITTGLWKSNTTSRHIPFTAYVAEAVVEKFRGHKFLACSSLSVLKLHGS